jgi:hypothetical protein
MLSVALLTALFSVSALANPVLKDEIKRTANSIYYLADSSIASESALQQARQKLSEALQLIQSTGPGHDFQKCFELVYQGYYRTLSSADATSRAQAACKTYKDLVVLARLDEYAYRSLGGADAMDLAVRHSGYSAQGKIKIVDYVFDKYYRSLGAADSVERTGSALPRLAIDSLSCLQTLYPKYYQSMNSVDAMDASIRDCGTK